MRVGVDMDGVVYPFMEDISAYLGVHGIEADLTLWKGWDGFAAWGLTKEQWLSWVDRAADEGVLFNAMAPFPGTVEALRRLRAAGHTVHLVTARNFGTGNAAVRNTCAWLSRFDVPFDSLHFETDKTAVETDFFIDDHLVNYDALVGAGRQTFLLDCSFNQVDGCARNRVSSLSDAVDRILEITSS